LVINRFVFDSTKIVNKRKLSVFKAGAYSAVSGAIGQLKLLPGVRITNLVDSVNFTANTDSVKQLAATYKANYVLTLDKFNAGIVLDNVQYDGYAQTAYYNTKAKVDFTLYESNGIYFKKLSGVADDPQSEGDYAGPLVSLLIHPTIKGNSISINASARNAALDALKDYLPYTITNNRPLYNQTDELQASVQQIMIGKFDRAFKILNPLIDGADLKLASRAAYNLAVVYEAQGDIEEALDLAKISNEKARNDYATVLIAELIKE
jgi:tetratricopeptide (TPR) repeat protein